MKKHFIPFHLVVMFIMACSTAQTVADREFVAVEIRNAVHLSDFQFVPRSAHPLGFRSVQLTPVFDVQVSPDTVHVNMPFFGRAFRASLDPTDAGYFFTSTEFDYSVEPGPRSGNWLVQIIFRDLDRRVVFNFDISESGMASLQVQDVHRQAISFQGVIVLRE